MEPINDKMTISVTIVEDTDDDFEYSGYKKLTMNRDYKNDVRWVVPLHDFVKLLSAQYGYDIAESIRKQFGWDISTEVYSPYSTKITNLKFDNTSIFDDTDDEDLEEVHSMVGDEE